jgi:hypothetical protein
VLEPSDEIVGLCRGSDYAETWFENQLLGGNQLEKLGIIRGGESKAQTTLGQPPDPGVPGEAFVSPGETHGGNEPIYTRVTARWVQK